MTRDEVEAIIAKSKEQGQPGSTVMSFQAANGDRTTFSGAFIIERADVQYVPNAQNTLDEVVKQSEGLILIQA